MIKTLIPVTALCLAGLFAVIVGVGLVQLTNNPEPDPVVETPDASANTVVLTRVEYDNMAWALETLFDENELLQAMLEDAAPTPPLRAMSYGRIYPALRFVDDEIDMTRGFEFHYVR